MNRLLLSPIAMVFGCLLLFAQVLWAAEANEEPVLTVEQVRGGFLENGFSSDTPIYWSSSALTTFFVRDSDSSRATERLLLVLVYPDTATAQQEHARLHAREETEQGRPVAFSFDRGPELIPGYGRSAWSYNVALVQASRSTAQQMSETVEATIVNTDASRRAQLRVLGPVDDDFIAVLRGLSASDA